MALETEIATFKQLLPELLNSSEGKYALIVGSDLKGVFDSDDDAWMAGYHAVGLHPFLLKKIEKMERVVLIPSVFVRAKVG